MAGVRIRGGSGMQATSGCKVPQQRFKALILALRRLKQKDLNVDQPGLGIKFKTSLENIVRPCLKKYLPQKLLIELRKITGKSEPCSSQLTGLQPGLELEKKPDNGSHDF